MLSNARSLELDEGIRIHLYKRPNSFVFVTRPAGRFVVAKYRAKRGAGGRLVPGDQSEFSEAGDEDELRSLLGRFLRGPFIAQRY